MWFSKSAKLGAISVIIAAVMPLPVMASCFICDEVVELDATSAACFTTEAEAYLTAAKSSERKIAEVDLSQCAGGSVDATRGLDSFTKLPSPDGAAPAASQARMVYMLDQQSITCLSRILSEAAPEFNPTAVIDLVEDCD